MLKFNKGEWSESYCLLKIISEKKLSVCNDALIFVGTEIKVTGGKLSDDILYKIYDNTVRFYWGENQKNYSLDDIRTMVTDIYKLLQSDQDRTFPINKIETLYSEIGNPSIKSNSSNKIDCNLSVFDEMTSSDEQLGFSIKSFLAGSPTLINASKATNFIYNTSTKAHNYNSLKTKKLVRALNDSREPIIFNNMESGTYCKNLMLIDTQMPLIISEILKSYFGSKTKTISDLSAIIEKTNPLKLEDTSIYKNKLKDFLFYSAIGMFPNKEWNGIQDVDGGCLIVKEDGEIATFYIFRKAFLEYFRTYLFDRCFLDTASTSRHRFGVLYEENNTTKLKLNLQVRITK